MLLDIKQRVGQIVKRYHTNDPYRICTYKGIVVRKVPLGGLLGYHTRRRRVSIIHINEAISEERQLFTVAHELGHAIMHPNVNASFLKSNTYYSNGKIEKEANLFAVELLFNQGGEEIVTIREATALYGVPEHLINKNF